MAEVALLAAVRKLGDLLGNQVSEEADLLYGVKDEVEWIERELTRMQCFLKDAEAKEMEDERVKNWIREVKGIACMAEDVVDTFNLEMESSTSRRGRFRGIVWNFISIFKKLKTRHNIGKKIQEIRLKIYEISESRSTYGIRNIDTGGDQGKNDERHNLKEWRRSCPHIEEPDFVGFKEDIEMLEERLLQPDDRRCVVSITGMGGLGKTTLAKKLYNRVRNNFNCLAWVYISQEYVVEDLLSDICKKVGLSKQELEEMNKEELKEMKKEELQEVLYKFLDRKTYLIVLDDIWKMRTWDELQGALPDGKSSRSKIIITTRNRDVAIHADARTPAHELPFLDEEESWELFSRKAFPINKEVHGTSSGSSTCPPELEALGREIVAKCGGLPLALGVMGGLLLRKQKTVQAWNTVLQSMNWQLSQDENRCMKILALSYNDLPHYLKSCFLYFGLYPEDHEISATKLFHLWIAEGFIEPRGQETLEDAAEECLDELTQRTLIQPASRRFDGRIKSCCIHDLLRDLSISKAEEGNFFDICEKVDRPKILSTVRRLAFHCSVPSLNHCNEHIRTIICFQNVPLGIGLCRGFKYLVILDLPGLKSRLPVEIGLLVNLKYLGLTDTINKLPSTIWSLRNLQTLDGKRSTLEVPATIWELRQLRHLYIGLSSKIQAPEEANDVSMGTLQTLSIQNVHISTRYVWNHLRNFTNLRKLKLKVDYMEKEGSCGLPESLQSLWLINNGEVAFQGLVFSSHLHLHKLFLTGRLEKLSDIHDQFPPHLTNLRLAYSRLKQDPMPFLERLPYLRSLKLIDDSYEGDKMVCSMGGFERLENLELARLDQMLEWEIRGGMQRLEKLTIHECKELKKIPDGLKEITTLKVLDIVMPSSFNSRLHKEDWDKIKHIPLILTKDKPNPRLLERIPTGVFDSSEEDLPCSPSIQRVPTEAFDRREEDLPCSPNIQEHSLKPKLRKLLACMLRKS